MLHGTANRLIKKKSGEGAKLKYWHNAEKNCSWKRVCKAMVYLPHHLSSWESCTGLPEPCLQPSSAGTQPLWLPAPEVPRQLAWGLSMGAKPKIGSLSRYTPSLCFRTLHRLPSMLLEELIRGKRGGHCPGQALCPQPRIIPMTAPWAAHPGAGSGPPVLPDQSHPYLAGAVFTSPATSFQKMSGIHLSFWLQPRFQILLNLACKGERIGGRTLVGRQMHSCKSLVPLQARLLKLTFGMVSLEFHPLIQVMRGNPWLLAYALQHMN